MKLVVVALAALLLAGCATRPGKTSRGAWGAYAEGVRSVQGN